MHDFSKLTKPEKNHHDHLFGKSEKKDGDDSDDSDDVNLYLYKYMIRFGDSDDRYLNFRLYSTHFSIFLI